MSSGARHLSERFLARRGGLGMTTLLPGSPTPPSPHPFLHLFIPKGFKSNEIVRADSKGFAGAFFVRAHPKGVTSFREHQSIAPPESREALSAVALSLVWSFPAARSSHFSGDSAGEILRWAQDYNIDAIRAIVIRSTFFARWERASEMSEGMLGSLNCATFPD